MILQLLQFRSQLQLMNLLHKNIRFFIRSQLLTEMQDGLETLEGGVEEGWFGIALDDLREEFCVVYVDEEGEEFLGGAFLGCVCEDVADLDLYVCQVFLEELEQFQDETRPGEYRLDLPHRPSRNIRQNPTRLPPINLLRPLKQPLQFLNQPKPNQIPTLLLTPISNIANNLQTSHNKIIIAMPQILDDCRDDA